MNSLSEEILQFLEGVPYAAVVLNSHGQVVAHNEQMLDLIGWQLVGSQYNRSEIFQHLEPDHLQSALAATISVPVRLWINGKGVSGDMKSFVGQNNQRYVMITVSRNGGLLALFNKLDVNLQTNPQFLSENQPEIH